MIGPCPGYDFLAIGTLEWLAWTEMIGNDSGQIPLARLAGVIGDL